MGNWISGRISGDWSLNVRIRLFINLLYGRISYPAFRKPDILVSGRIVSGTTLIYIHVYFINYISETKSSCKLMFWIKRFYILLNTVWELKLFVTNSCIDYCAVHFDGRLQHEKGCEVCVYSYETLPSVAPSLSQKRHRTGRLSTPQAL